MPTKQTSERKPILDGLDETLSNLCKGEDPPVYTPDPDDVKAAKSVKDGIFDGQRNWCHDD
ncbi:MAG: hypothetical protein VW405_09250 [Rhodospirillaceae bacterium]